MSAFVELPDRAELDRLTAEHVARQTAKAAADFAFWARAYDSKAAAGADQQQLEQARQPLEMSAMKLRSWSGRWPSHPALNRPEDR